jgi:hypothetical protein
MISALAQPALAPHRRKRDSEIIPYHSSTRLAHAFRVDFDAIERKCRFEIFL